MIIPNLWHVDSVISALRHDGVNALHVLSDFDRTLTHGTIWGTKTPSLISLLRDGEHLSQDYPARALSLFGKYHPIEIDPDIPIEEKKTIMKIWWYEHFSLMIECGLKKDDIFDVIKKSHLKLRDYVDVTLQLLKKNDVPFIIISAGAIGEAIPLFLASQWLDFPNISYICNHFEWDERWYAKAIREPIIHVFNKDEATIREMPTIHDRIAERKNIILIGDSLWDLGMSDGCEYENILRIGFLNSEDREIKKDFIKNFDVIIEWDGDFSFVKECLENILN